MMTKDSCEVLVIGLGNPILGDDGVGWRIVQKVEEALKEVGIFGFGHSVKFEYLSLGGLSLMEHMAGHTDVIVVDSVLTGGHLNGTIYCLPLGHLPNLSAGHTTAIHDTSLATALEVGRRMGMVLPSEVWVVAVEAENVYDFSEFLSEPVAAAVPVAADLVLDMLQKNIREEKVYDIT